MNDSAAEVIDLQLEIPRREVRRFLGYPPTQHPPDRISAMLDEVLPQARELAVGRGCFQRLPPDRASEVELESLDADGLVLGLVTAGPGIEATAQKLLATGQMTRALLLDAAGSAAAEEAADRLGAQIVGQPSATASTDAVSCRLSPGYGRWKLSAQPKLFALLPHETLGVELSQSCMMLPRKSISFAMWLGAVGPIRSGVAGCSRCELAHCRYRRANPSSPSPNKSDYPQPKVHHE